MIVQVNVGDVNRHILHQELIEGGYPPTLFEVGESIIDITFVDGTSSSGVQAILDAHDPTVEDIDDFAERDLYKYKIAKESNVELRTFFRSLDSEHQLNFRKAFSEYWGGVAATDTDIHLVFESMFRILLRVMYIKDVEERALTTEEQTEYETLLGYFNDHNTALEPYLPRTGWCLPLIDRVIDDMNTTRFSKVFPNLAEITGPIIEERVVTSTVEPIEGNTTTS
jgi:hypothetical protein